ncbi:MAG: ATP-dependent DNA helicase UvrD2 [Acidimicrobiales bacterium]
MSTEGLLDGLTDSQLRAVTIDAEPLVVLAGAGSGKTRVLTRRIAWRVETGRAEAAHVLAVTFTRKAAGELRGRLRALGVRDNVAAGTFHSLAYAQLRRRWADTQQAPPTLMERKVSLLGQLLPRHNVRGSRAQAGRSLLADLAAEIEWAKARLVRPDDYLDASARAARRPPLPASEVARIYARYESEKRRRSLVDFDDLLDACATAMESDPAFAASQRWRFRHLYVDEVQDINPAQWRLLQAWLGGRSDLCIVGDPNQAIYSWNGADPSFLSDFSSTQPKAGVVRLEENWRSTPQVLGVAAAVLGAPSGSTAAHVIRPQRSSGPLPSLTSYEDDRDEARAIARRLRSAHGQGRRWADLAVLTRTNAQLVLLQEALGAAGVPYRLPQGALLLAQPEIVEALSELERTAARRPPASWTPDLEELAERAEGPSSRSGGADDRRLHLEELARLASEYATLDPAGTPAGFSAWLAATVRAERSDTDRDAVELGTFHRAKGLEWEVVFLAGLEQGLVPIAAATTPAADAEERRLLYVAATRARQELHCSWARRRMLGTRPVPRRPSPYLEAVEDALAAMDRGVAPMEALERVRAAREGLARSAGPSSPHRSTRSGAPRQEPSDPRLLGELRAWRAAAARASGVPAYVIFHDSTLSALAERRPRTPEGLLEVPGLGPVKVMRYGEALLGVLGGAESA